MHKSSLSNPSLNARIFRGCPPWPWRSSPDQGRRRQSPRSRILCGIDPALTARVPRTVNSAYFGLGKPVASIQRGIGYMGFNALVSLILGFSLVDMTRRRQDHFDFVGLGAARHRGRDSGRIAMWIADRVPEHHELTDEAFAADCCKTLGCSIAGGRPGTL